MPKGRYTRFRSEIKGKELYRVPLAITWDMERYLRDLSDKMKSTGGYKLPKSYILRSLIKAAQKLDIDVTGVKKESELTDRILKAMRK